ncbi:tetratricopeptide repeat protein [Jiulongibacter sp. NS-SX5]|uniref:tetratricopeptide repeat protein n=1 Tax=Jiulongibacter sp. NS-SX5 TaxID=3463854 RepID=UPI004059AD71
MAKKKVKKQKVAHAAKAVESPLEIAETNEFEPKLWYVGVGMLVAVYLAYALIWQNGLVWDDDPYIILNDAVQEFNLTELLSGFHVGNYHPLTMLSLGIEYLIAGESPWIYHFNNLWLHALNSTLVYLLLRKISVSTWVALFTAAFFALHPLHVESVAWAAERKDVLYTLFLLLSFIFYIKFKDTDIKKYYIISLLMFVLSCLSKGMAVVLPALLIITDWWFLAKEEKAFSKNVWLNKLPYFAITLFFAYIATTAQKDAGADASEVIGSAYTGFERVRIVAYSFWFYWVKTLAPIDLLPFYPYPGRVDGDIPGIYNLALVGLIVATIIVFILGRKNKKVWWGVSFFTIAVSTVLQILPVGSAIVADRYYYLSSIGPLFLLSLLIVHLTKRYKGIQYLGFGLVLICGALTFAQVKHWKNGYTLFSPAEEVYPQDAMVLSNIGWYHLGEKDFAMAKQYLTQADNNGFKNADVCRTLASMYIDEGEYDKAIPYLNRAYQYMPVKPRTDWLMAMALSKQSRYEEALPFAEKAHNSEPDNAEYTDTYASVMANLGMGEQSRQLYDQLKVESGESPAYRLNAAYSYKKEGDIELEIELLKGIINDHPDYLPAYQNIGVSLSELGRHDETISFWEKAAELDASGDYEYNIGINYANRNMVDRAIPWYQKAAKKGKSEAVDILTRNGVEF